jgi:hypothetical protein
MIRLMLLALIELACGGTADDLPVSEEPCETEPGAEWSAWHDPAQAFIHVQRKHGYAVQIWTIHDTDPVARTSGVDVEVREDMSVCLL